MRVALAFLVLCVALSNLRAAAPYTVHTGEIEGAKFAYAQPAKWNRGILLLAHGVRPESAPLVADLFPERAAYLRLIQEGWVIAKTSYRRNGIIIADAITDLDNLRDELVRRLGPPDRVLIEGESMGGLIAVLMAERAPDNPLRYHGVVAIGPALGAREPNADTPGLSMIPQIPVVFLCNRTEIEAAQKYTEIKFPQEVRRPVPYLLRVSRDGHININQAERLVGLRAVNAWIDRGRDALPKPENNAPFLDVTKVPEPVPSRVFVTADQRGFTAHVLEVTDVFGNLLLDIQAADLATIGLVRGAYVEMTINEKPFRVLYGKDFSSVKRGEWVVFENADGFYWLGRNGLSAASATDAQIGDLVHVRRYDSATAVTPKP